MDLELVFFQMTCNEYNCEYCNNNKTLEKMKRSFEVDICQKIWKVANELELDLLFQPDFKA